MFVHIQKIIEHAQSWLAKEGHAVDSAVAKTVESLLSHVAEKSQEEFSLELLRQKGYTVYMPVVAAPPVPVLSIVKPEPAVEALPEVQPPQAG